MNAGQDEPVLVVDSVTVEFGGIKALDEVSLAVRPRTIHALIGPNGAGKTTLFNAVTRIVPVSEGAITLDGEPIENLPVHQVAERGIARTFQNLASFGDLTVEENLLLGRHVRTSSGWIATGMASRKARTEAAEQREFVARIAQRLNLLDLLKSPAARLSYGDRKRVELGRALCAEPSLLLLDEPVAGMNPAEVDSMIESIRTLADGLGLTVILVEHHMGMVARLADYMSVLDFGQLIAEGAPEEIQNDPAVVEAYVGKRGVKLFEQAD